MTETAQKPPEAPRTAAYWEKEIEKATKRWKSFWEEGDTVIDEYRMQKASGGTIVSEDKYNILYSSTETVRPNLYAQVPNAQVPLRNKDRADPVASKACKVLEDTLNYLIEEEDFDNVLENAVEDLILPGLGQAWVRYEPTIEGDEVIDEQLLMEHVYWQDWICGASRGWKTVPWVGKRCWMNKTSAVKRFGQEKADRLKYSEHDKGDRSNDNSDEEAEVWEIWDKTTGWVYWYCRDCSGDALLDALPDPLKLKKFFPCPRPLRAVFNTRTFVPRSLYSQYKSQAKQLNSLTRRIRYLTDALRVAGVYDGSQEGLKDLLNAGSGNKMIKVDSWVAFAQNGGIKGSVEWLPIADIVAALIQLIQAREICKNEIYEITGFSDIVRGVSKASETLGAQNIKQNWASARLRKMQKEVQRFARDVLALAGEVAAEHCSDITFALYSGIQVPTPDPQTNQINPDALRDFQVFKQAVQLLKNEKTRCAKIDIETDSTLLANEEEERKDRMDFLGAAGSFLQQAVPAMQTMPELGGLLGAMMMFTVRTFPSSRVIEAEFEKVQKALEAKLSNPQPPPPDPNQIRAKSQENIAGQRAQVDQQKISEETARHTNELASEERLKQQELANKAIEEQNRHEEKMAELALQQQELELEKRKLDLEEDKADWDKATTLHEADCAEMDAKREDTKAAHDMTMDKASHEHQVGMDEANLAETVQQNEHARSMDAKEDKAEGENDDSGSEDS